MLAALRRRLNHINPDLVPPIPEAEPDNIPYQRAFFENSADCTCPILDSQGQNPTCPTHPWWRRDPLVLQLADPDDPWQAAMQTFGCPA